MSKWKKYEGNPVFGDTEIGTCFDLIVLPGKKGEKKYKMYFSWRPKSSLAISESDDGINWSYPQIIFEPRLETGWEDNINRNAIVEKDGKLHLWYTGQGHGNSYIGYAVSETGKDSDFKRCGDEPVIVPEQPWENMSVMCPCVLWNEEKQLFQMWYSAGETHEPNVICYATSPDGINWKKHKANPIFIQNREKEYEQERVGGCQVIPYKGGYLMFYIGYKDINTANVCGAWSPDGISRWRRFKANPIAAPDAGKWDGDACYKPSAIYDEENDRWLLWYNGRNGAPEYIGLVIHEGDINEEDFSG
ncbi:hypothetical protein FACS1894219_07070 [Clostridia bacterium]|nr:hypothetical protein FACS1894219_07070 [Clostridia bacterium]